MADADAPQEITIEDADKIIAEMQSKLGKDYSENDNQCSESDQIWVKFYVTGKGRKTKMILGEKGTCIEDIPNKAFKAEDKEVSQIWIVARGHDDDGPLRTYTCVFYFQAMGLGVMERSRYAFNKNFLEAMQTKKSIAEQIDAGDIDGGWPCQDVGEGELKWQSYLKRVKTNAGAHSVKTYLFGANESRTF